jgi:hypothetical protein
MEKILSIGRLEKMIKAIKENNLTYSKYKRIPKHACGVFKFEERELVQHRHIGVKEYKTIKY